jgi:beta-glucanase (GH16 family)
MRRTLDAAGAALTALSIVACGGSSGGSHSNGDASTGLHSETGGANAGGTSSTGGASSSGTGGTTSTGGTSSSGASGGTSSRGASGGASSGGTSGTGTGGSSGSSGDAGPGALPGWKLVWSDEFEGPANQKPDASKWVFETGGNGWGNNELEYYTSNATNASLDGNGSLVITARSETYQNRNYTSARLKTQGKFEHTYGRFEARIQIPKGQGLWPAFWMLGNDIGTAGWPTCGEVDIMENVGKEPSTVHGTIHGPGYSGGNGLGAPYQLPGKNPFADDFHVYAVEWKSDSIKWFVDDASFETRTPADVPQGDRWVYDHPFFILLNVAVGGQWPGNPDGTTTFPQTMIVDYVRVYDPAP